MEGYRAEIIEGSRVFNKVEKILITAGTHTPLEADIAQADVVVDIEWWAKVAIHNEKSENKDYNVFLVKDKMTGIIYQTSSSSFIASFENIWNIMTEDMEDTTHPCYSIVCKQKESNNYKGKFFFTCDIVA